MDNEEEVTQLRKTFQQATYHEPVNVVMRRGERLRKRRFAFIAMPFAVLIIAAGGYSLLTADNAPKNIITCFSEASLPSSDNSISATGAEVGSGGPIETCRRYWADGLVKENSTSPPALVACLDPRYPGSVLVFPGGEDVCRELHLQELPDGYYTATERFLAMRDEVVASIRAAAISSADAPSEACLDEETARRVVAKVVAKHNLSTEWRVILSSARQPDECAQNPQFDDQEKTITIGPTDPGELPRLPN